MKRIEFSCHALDRMPTRGAITNEIDDVIQTGEAMPARRGRLAFRKNQSYEAKWKDPYYETKQMVAVIKEETECFVVVTVFVSYYGGRHENKL